MRRAFTLIELLVVIALLAMLIGLLLPTLAKARESGRSVRCLSNLRSIGTIVQAYADEYKGYGPALGWPYDRAPNWAVVAQQSAGVSSDLARETRAERSVLVCPSNTAYYGRAMLRCYAMNVTGRAGLPGDPSSFEPLAGDPDPRPTHLRLDRISRPSDTPMLVDAQAMAPASDGTPSLLCASVLDFRQQDHLDNRLGRFHASRRGWHAGMYDSSARIFSEPPQYWTEPLP